MQQLKFIDLCAGIGGGRLGLEYSGFKCAGYAEIDKNASKTYKIFFGENESNYEDVMHINPLELPEADVMIAGFPCQSFSIIGQRKGLADDRGQIIYGLINILKGADIPYFIFENVKGLINHEKGRTLKIMLSEINQAGYAVRWQIFNSIDFGVPQMRERIYLVGVRKDRINKSKLFKFPQGISKPSLDKYLVDDGMKLDPYTDKTFIKYINNKYNKGRFSLDKLLQEEYLILDTRQSDLRLYRGRVPTLRTGRHGILYVKKGQLQRLTGYESLLLQGFPENYAQKVKGKISEATLLSQAGNAMTVSTVAAIGNSLAEYIGIKGQNNLKKIG